MNQLWIRLSFAFAVVLTVSFLLVALVVQLNYADPDVPPPPEVVAYFEQLQAQRLAPNPFLAFVIVGSMALVAGVIVSRMLASPISELEEAAANVGRGELATRVEPRGSQEIIAVAAAFNDMAARLEQAEAVRQNLLADVAHELRHPLQVLQGNLQAMQDGVFPVNKEEIDRLITQTHHFAVMINDLHVLSQAEARQLPLHIQDVAIAELLKEVAAFYQPLAAGRNIDLHVQLLGTVPHTIPLDRARIRQAVQNLLENALRHTADGGHIIMTVQQQNGRLFIEVKDDGQGIEPDQLPLVFERFYRGDRSRPRGEESTGLGLAISKALVNAHAGTITVESAGIGGGSTFTIMLPLERKQFVARSEA